MKERAAIVGVGMSDFGDHLDVNAWDLAADAYNEARADVEKGIDPNDIGCVVLSSMLAGVECQQVTMEALIVNQLGLAGKPTFRTAGPACATSTSVARRRSRA